MLRVIYLPYTNFRQSVACYSDNVLLGTFQNLARNFHYLDRSRRDINYNATPVWESWSGYKQAYIRLALMCEDELKERYIKYDESLLNDLIIGIEGKHWTKPIWVGWDRLHTSHKAGLMLIGEVERLGVRIIRLNNLEKASPSTQEDVVNEWFYANGFDNLYQRDMNYVREANDLLTDDGAPLADDIPNHYAQFYWDVEPNGFDIIRPLAHDCYNLSEIVPAIRLRRI